MTKLTEIWNGFSRTFSMDNPRSAKQRKPVCRECEILGSAASFSGAAYFWHMTRTGRVMPHVGTTGACILGCFGFALILSFPPEDETNAFIKQQRKTLREEHETQEYEEHQSKIQNNL